jgi:hypothetical protein
VVSENNFDSLSIGTPRFHVAVFFSKNETAHMTWTVSGRMTKAACADSYTRAKMACAATAQNSACGFLLRKI